MTLAPDIHLKASSTFSFASPIKPVPLHGSPAFATLFCMPVEHHRNRTAPDQVRESLMIHHEQIPCELFAYTQWVCWRYVDRGEGRKPDKQPVNPRTLANAGGHWASTWTSFKEAYATYLRHCNQ